jgi:hypothetical protein
MILSVSDFSTTSCPSFESFASWEHAWIFLLCCSINSNKLSLRPTSLSSILSEASIEDTTPKWVMEEGLSAKGGEMELLSSVVGGERMDAPVGFANRGDDKHP